MKPRILYTQDFESLLDLNTMMMVDEGYEVLPFSNGEDAFKAYLKEVEEGRSVDLVITDWNMPGRGGGGLIKDLRDKGYKGLIAIVSEANPYYFRQSLKLFNVFHISDNVLECLKAYEEMKKGE